MEKKDRALVKKPQEVETVEEIPRSDENELNTLSPQMAALMLKIENSISGKSAPHAQTLTITNTHEASSSLASTTYVASPSVVVGGINIHNTSNNSRDVTVNISNLSGSSSITVLPNNITITQNKANDATCGNEINVKFNGTYKGTSSSAIARGNSVTVRNNPAVSIPGITITNTNSNVSNSLDSTINSTSTSVRMNNVNINVNVNSNVQTHNNVVINTNANRHASITPRVLSRDSATAQPLLVACERGKFSEVHSLLEAEASPDTVLDDDGNTALHIASRCGNLQAVTALLLAGASTDKRNAQGKKPIDVASSEAVRHLLRSPDE